MADRLLILTYYWPPSGGPGVQRWLKFVRYLRDEGFEPEVLTVANPTYSILDPSLSADIPEGIRVHTAPAWEPYELYARLTGKKPEEVSKPTMRLDSRGASREGIGTWIRGNLFIPDARIGWIRPLFQKARELAESGAYCGFITTGPPHSTHLAGRRLQKATGLYWLADMRDPWTTVYYNHLIPRTRLARWIDRKLEGRVLRHADDVVVVSPGMKREFEPQYPNRYHVIPNGYDEADLPPPVQRKPGPFLFRHIGSMAESTLPFGFFNALSRLDPRLDWALEFIGNVHTGVHALAGQHGLGHRVRFIPYVPHAAALQAMAEADVLCLFLSKTAGAESIYTGKLFEYAGLNKPVLLIGPTQGDAARFLADAGLGLSREHADEEGIFSLLSGLISGTQPLPRSDSAQQAFVQGFTRRALTRRLAGIVRNGLARRA